VPLGLGAFTWVAEPALVFESSSIARTTTAAARATTAIIATTSSARTSLKWERSTTAGC
jgi:hypothetical protein